MCKQPSYKANMTEELKRTDQRMEGSDCERRGERDALTGAVTSRLRILLEKVAPNDLEYQEQTIRLAFGF